MGGAGLANKVAASLIQAPKVAMPARQVFEEHINAQPVAVRE
jgi:hypothetical protein